MTLVYQRTVHTHRLYFILCRTKSFTNTLSVNGPSHKSPSDTEEGKKHTVCINCGATMRTAVIPATVEGCKHENVETVNSLEPSCVTDGYTGDTVCKDCKKVIETGTVLPALVHKIA